MAKSGNTSNLMSHLRNNHKTTYAQQAVEVVVQQ